MIDHPWAPPPSWGLAISYIAKKYNNKKIKVLIETPLYFFETLNSHN